MTDVPRTIARRFEEPPLSWHPGWATDHPIAIFTCPGGSTGSLHDWTIASDGTVTPSVDCRCGCGFHDHIRLLEWEPDWLPPRAASSPASRLTRREPPRRTALVIAARGEDLSGFPRSGELRKPGARGGILKSLRLRRVLSAQVSATATPPGRLLAVADRIAGRATLSDERSRFVASLPAMRFEIGGYVHLLPPTLGTLTRSWSHREARKSSQSFALDAKVSNQESGHDA